MRGATVAIVVALLAGTAHADVPDTLTREMIRKGIASVSAQTKKCTSTARQFSVKLTVKVAPDGTSTVTIKEGDSKVAVCLKRAVQKARYQVTKNGATFTHPFSAHIFED